MTKLADVIDAVVGADTHRDTHTLEITTATGVTLSTLTVANTDAGAAQALAWINQNAPGPRIAAAVEGSRSYGVGLARALNAAGVLVLEIEQPRGHERRRGKSDAIDAHLAAIHALRLDTDKLPTPRADGDREALRILLTARQELGDTRRRSINQLRALLITGDDTDRALNRPKQFAGKHLDAIINRAPAPGETREQTVRRSEAARLATRIRDTTADLAANTRELTTIVTEMAPALVAKLGVGPVSAAQAIVSWSHRGRCRNEAAFAALAGASPLEASSGRTARHRLNRGGDRALNCALHAIVLTRWRACTRTHDYIARRRAQGNSDREIRRMLKRYVARELFRTLNTTPTLA
ncbi:transposase [Amycolatopsis sp. FDAARGOS 1241]|uniref:IS110 family transposase n=1 Tax=Amycolatopsis sp. FDAARGOS 1241 TaxID=2778070 RepID=UPI00195259C3|nr:transposase [Amycolatopsis sp. FDAARGOS 1241]QRP43084.1 transposase [Amycolatopsis sp. FDAARGOS 1241]QRP48095.1 transposase [Amycolatopsis sp. FDAARGOS 1241]